MKFSLKYVAVALATLNFGAFAATPTTEPIALIQPVEAGIPLAGKELPPDALRWSKRTGEVRIDLQPILQPRKEGSSRFAAGQRISVELFRGETFTFKGDRVEEFSPGQSTWVGTAEDTSDGSMQLSYANEKLFGFIDVGTAHYVVQGDTTRGFFVKEALQGHAGKCPMSGEFVGSIKQPLAFGRPNAAKGASSGRVLDVLILYSPGAASYVDVEAASYAFESSMNDSFDNSSIDGAIRIVGFEYISGATEPSTVNDFYGIAQYMQSGGSVYAGVPELRDDYGADLVMMLVDKGTNPAICGIAVNIPEEDESNSTTANIAYAVTSVDCASTDYTFTHELGHLLGVRHDYATSCSPLLACDNATAPYTWSHGYTDKTVDFRDMMGSQNSTSGTDCDLDTDGCPRLNRWSSPSQYVTIGQSSYLMSDSSTYTDAKLSLDGDGTTTNPGTIGPFTSHVVPTFSAPGQPSAINRDSGCYGTYDVYWSASSGTLGWYEVQASYSTSFTSPFLIYRGTATNIIYSVGTSGSTQYGRVRGCNAAGCSSWRSYVTMPTQNYCL